LESYDVRPFINGSTRSKLTKAQAERIPIPLPPLDEQRRIAAILDKADALRRMRKRALDLLENAKNSFVELALRKASRGKTEALGEYLNFITTGGRNWSKYYSLEGSRFIRSLDVQMNSISQEDPVYVAAPENAEARRTRTHKGDVLLTVTGSRIGRVAELPAGLTGSYVSQHVAILRPNLAKLRPKFLSFFLSSREGQRQIQKWQYGQTKPGLNFKQIEGFLIPKISVDQQVRFEGIAERFEALLSVQKDDCMRLTSLFSSLQHRAFSGQL
jgi:type I restriction enzyme S subunit